MFNILSKFLKCIGCMSNDSTSNLNNNTNEIKTINSKTLSYHKNLNLLEIKGNFLVKSVYDGDTVTLELPINLSVFNYESIDTINLQSINNPDNSICLYEIRVRLLGIDTPEMKPSKNLPNREEHIKKAIEAKEFLSSQILNKIITVKFKQNDKYGRPLVELFNQDININNLMVEKGYAKSYDGGTKDTDF